MRLNLVPGMPGTFARIVTTAVMVVGVALVAAGPAQAEAPCEVTDEITGEITYVDCDDLEPEPDPIPDPDNPDTNTPPPCDLSSPPYTDMCDGKAACEVNDPSLNDEPDVADDAGPKPGEDYHIAFKFCIHPDTGSYFEWYWVQDTGPSLEELALRAYGALRVPAFTPVFNPPNRTIVNLDTWWWADGANTTEIVGSAAGDIRAIATPDHLEVDPGDGSGTTTCAFSTTKSDACSYTYRRASNRGTATGPDGSKAYPARMRLVWDVRFEDGGAPLELAGLPTTIATPWNGQPVVVREVQTVVRPRNR